MKHIIFLLLVVVAIGCSPERRVARIYSHNPELIPRDTTITLIQTRDSIIYRDSTITIRIPAVPDTVEVEGEVVYRPGRPLQIHPDTLIAETAFAKAVAWIDYNRLKMRLYEKDSLLRIQLDSALKESYYWKDQWNTKTTTITNTEIHIPEFYKVMAWVGVGMVLLSIVIVLIRFKL